MEKSVQPFEFPKQNRFAPSGVLYAKRLAMQTERRQNKRNLQKEHEFFCNTPGNVIQSKRDGIIVATEGQSENFSTGVFDITDLFDCLLFHTYSHTAAHCNGNRDVHASRHVNSVIYCYYHAYRDTQADSDCNKSAGGN